MKSLVTSWKPCRSCSRSDASLAALMKYQISSARPAVQSDPAVVVRDQQAAAGLAGPAGQAGQPVRLVPAAVQDRQAGRCGQVGPAGRLDPRHPAHYARAAPSRG
jgi:hypothetical protein